MTELTIVSAEEFKNFVLNIEDNASKISRINIIGDLSQTISKTYNGLYNYKRLKSGGIIGMAGGVGAMGAAALALAGPTGGVSLLLGGVVAILSGGRVVSRSLKTYQTLPFAEEVMELSSNGFQLHKNEYSQIVIIKELSTLI